jgi:hypothetical protein
MADPLSVVAYAYDTGGFTTRSDYSRAHSEEIAQAACCGLITTARPADGSFGNFWRVSPFGLMLLFRRDLQSNEIPNGPVAGPHNDSVDTRHFGDTYSG